MLLLLLLILLLLSSVELHVCELSEMQQCYTSIYIFFKEFFYLKRKLEFINFVSTEEYSNDYYLDVRVPLTQIIVCCVSLHQLRLTLGLLCLSEITRSRASEKRYQYDV